MEQNEVLLSLSRDIAEIKKAVLPLLPHNIITEKWIPRSEVMAFLSYKPTQMATLEKELVVTKVGKRKFINRASLERLLEQNILPATIHRLTSGNEIAPRHDSSNK